MPDFKGADGKHLRYGTKEYFDAFNKWLSTDDARFYTKWRNDLREYGDDKYDLKVAGEKIQIGRGSGQEVRGYQSLVTLMQQGHGYSPQFVADITDDMIALEKEDPDVWDLRGHFSGKEDGWFANDPVDGALGVMSHNPEGAAGYLDPGTSAGKERLDYLLGDGEGSRDWKVTNTTRWQGNIEFTASDELDTDDRKGLGDAPGGSGRRGGPEWAQAHGTGAAHGCQQPHLLLRDGHTVRSGRRHAGVLAGQHGQGDDESRRQGVSGDGEYRGTGFPRDWGTIG
ncbi:hypothetical protein ABZ202_16830 [Streptomyces sp. NPDC006186]|uniref:hypothetical protein n=1 Tax=Streptomyces sp. NPDC006186 TaxID=3155248 RepID=UPI0033AB6095